MTQYTLPHSIPIIDREDLIAAPNDNLRTSINAVATATNTALTAQSYRLDAVELASAGGGLLTTNAVIDPLPLIADTTTYATGRCNLSRVGSRGRATCTASGATYFFSKASAGATVTPAERFPVTPGTAVSSRVTIYGHPTVDMGATLEFGASRWDGSAFVFQVAPFTTSLIRIPAGESVTLELAGVVTSPETTHIVPQVNFRRWGASYPNVGDYIEWSNFALNIGGAATQSPIPYVDGNMVGAYWMGLPGRSPSRGIIPGRGESGVSSARRDTLTDAFRRRRGRKIGTAGRAVVSLRFDHGWNRFVSDILPLLRERGLPALQMVNPGEMTAAPNNAVSYADIQSMWINDGVEVANHALNHGAAVTQSEVDAHITGALATLQANIPNMPIELYVPGGSPGAGDENFTGSTEREFWDTHAGRITMSSHAAIVGYRPGMYRPMPQDLDLGASHASCDTWTQSAIIGAIDGAIQSSAALTLMWHPALLDTSGGNTKAQLTAILDYLVSKIDSGELVVLTQTGALLADPGTDARSDLILNGDFSEGLSRWSNATGWTPLTRDGITYATTSSGGQLQQVINGRYAQGFEGSNRVLTARVRATGGAVLGMQVTGGNGLDASHQVTLPAAAGWVEVRKPLAMPLGVNSVTVNIGRVSGGTLDIRDVRLEAS